MSRPIPDLAVRQQIQFALDQTLLVEAGAGSGKTTSLVARMLALVSSGTCRVQEMAAVTFTRKAAAELQERFQIKLEQALVQNDDPAVRLRLQDALQNIQRLFIGTVHAFCGRMLRERPVEANLPPDFVELEEWEATALADRAWQDYLGGVSREQPEVLAQLAELDIGLAALHDLFRQLCLQEDVQFESSACVCPDPVPALAALDRLVQAAKPNLPDACPAAGWDKLQSMLRQYLLWQTTMDLSEPRLAFRLLAELGKKAEITQNRWPDKQAAKRLLQDFLAWQESTLAPVLAAWREYRYQPVLAFVLPAVEQFRRQRQAEGKLSFQDLLFLARDLLRDHPEVRGYFQRKYTHLLVDEFQDTDPVQAEIMLYLAGEDLAETDFTRLALRPGSLFVVGDPKQSIYRFRRADIEVYDLVKQAILRSGGAVLTLSANFRSLEPVVNWVNGCFAELFPCSAAPYQTAYQEMHPARDTVAGAASGARLLPFTASGRTASDILQADAEQVADWIAWAVDNLEIERTAEELSQGTGTRLRPEDVLILTRYKKGLAAYGEALAKRQIPFSLSGGGDPSECAEFNELLLLCRLLANPADSVLLVAVLRGLFFGISDSYLQRFRQAGGEFSFLLDLPEFSDAELKPAFVSAWEMLRRFWGYSVELPPSTTLERILAESGILSWTFAAGQRQAAPYLLQAVELVRSQEQKGRSTFAQAVEFLQLLQQSGAEDGLDILTGAESGVRIMNLHKAKGLEAPVVILANPSHQVNRAPDLHVRRRAALAQGFVALQQQYGNGHGGVVVAQSANWEEHQAEESKYQQAEEVRLLYVAATRTKNLLLVTCAKGHEQKSPWQALHPYLETTAESVPVAVTRSAQPVADPVDQPLPAWSEAEAKVLARREQLRQPSLRQVSVTQLVKGGDLLQPERVDTGRGFAWGNAVHAALRALADRTTVDDWPTYCRSLLLEQGLGGEELPAFLALIAAVARCELWQRAMASPLRHTEVPFGSYQSGEYLSGIIDLIFWEADGWVLVDYKSDKVIDASHHQQLRDYYQPQIDLYQEQWQRISGQPVKECHLLFTDLCQ